jgi:hypothetical protein
MSDPDRTEWLEWRRGGIGASDIAGILGLSPWASPYSVWANKMGITPAADMTEAMEMGHALEPAIATLFHQRTGLHVSGAQTQCQHPDKPWARCTVDGWATEIAYYDGVTIPDVAKLGTVQSKTTADSPAKWEDGIPMMYAAQVQWEMYVTNTPKAWVPVIHAAFGLRFRVYEVERSESDIAFIVKHVERFWNDHVVAALPPSVDGHVATTEALGLIPATDDTTVVLTNPDGKLIALRRLTAEIARLEEQKAAATNALKAAMGDNTVAVVALPDGSTERVATWKDQTRTSLDSAALKVALPDVYQQYAKTTTSRVFRLATTKEK